MHADGVYLGQSALALVSFAVLLALRPTPVPSSRGGGTGRPLREIVAQPRFLVALAAGRVSYGARSCMMTAAPVAMVVGCGHSVGDATLGIQWHILAMFGPSFFTGRLLDRFGKPQVVTVGLALTGLAAVVGASGTSVAHFWTALVLLGVGWNFGFIGATALVMECCRPAERTKTQAANDFLVFGSVAVASFSSGQLLDAGGWLTVTLVVLPAVALALLAVAWGARAARPVSEIA